MKPTKDQKIFLKKHGISLDEVFDASDYTKAEYNAFMKDTMYRLAIGVTPCVNAGHTMRTRHGHCVMCNPAPLSFQKRFTNDGEIYLMYSASKKLVKVGIAANAYKRKISLNKRAYGGLKDWVVKYSIKVTNVGHAENAVRKILNKYHFPLEHEPSNSNVAGEIYKCSIKKAKAAIDSVIDFG
jgi:hypothetical protein